MTSLKLLERMNDLSDGVIRPFNATREGRRGSISEIPAEVICYFNFGLLDHKETLRGMERFAREVMPHFAETKESVTV